MIWHRGRYKQPQRLQRRTIDHCVETSSLPSAALQLLACSTHSRWRICAARAVCSLCMHTVDFHR
jgi:hypothetical protein